MTPEERADNVVDTYRNLRLLNPDWKAEARVEWLKEQIAKNIREAVNKAAAAAYHRGRKAA